MDKIPDYKFDRNVEHYHKLLDETGFTESIYNDYKQGVRPWIKSLDINELIIFYNKLKNIFS